MTGIALTSRQHDDLGQIHDWFFRRAESARGPIHNMHAGARRPIFATLLDSITDTMDDAQAVTMVPVAADNVVQEVTLKGDLHSSTGFTLTYPGLDPTDVIFPLDPPNSADRTPGQNSSIETKLNDRLGSRAVKVSGGKGRWWIRYTNGFVNPAGPAAPIELLEFGDTKYGDNVDGHVIARSRWEAIGRIETVRPVLPVTPDCPMSIGNHVVALWFPGFGYGAIVIEWRELNLFAATTTGGYYYY